MANPFVAEIRIFSFNFAPTGWAQCNGQLLPITQNPALFSLLGTMYGGNGQTNFALPDLRGRTPISFGQNTIGSVGGAEFVTLNTQTMAQHIHMMNADGTTPAANQPTPGAAGSSVFGNANGTTTPTGTFTVAPYNPGAPNGA